MRTILAVVLFMFLTELSWAVEEQIANRYVKEAKLTVTALASSPLRALAYGNTTYGFFRVRDYSWEGTTLSFRLIPPGYREALQVYAKREGTVGWEPLGLLSYTNPTPPEDLAPSSVKITGKLSANFFLSQAEPHGKGVAYIVNRQGEIVWMYQPRYGTPGVVKALGKGRYGMVAWRQSAYEVFDYSGQLSYGESNLPYPAHHDFVSRGEDAFLTLGLELTRLLEPKAGLKPGLYQTTTVIRINPQTKIPTTLWSFLKDGPLLYSEGWVPDSEIANPSNTWKNYFPSNEPIYDLDHSNALEYVPGQGYLLSLRHLSSLVFLDENFRTLWTMGPFREATYCTLGSNAQFARQHNPSILPNGDILLLDNGIAPSPTRVLIVKKEPASGTISLVKEFLPLTPLSIKQKGSASLIESSGNVLGGFVQATSGKSYAIEFDRASGVEVARLETTGDLGRSEYRFQPISTIGTETYLGPTLPE